MTPTQTLHQKGSPKLGNEFSPDFFTWAPKGRRIVWTNHHFAGDMWVLGGVKSISFQKKSWKHTPKIHLHQLQTLIGVWNFLKHIYLVHFNCMISSRKHCYFSNVIFSRFILTSTTSNKSGLCFGHKIFKIFVHKHNINIYIDIDYRGKYMF